VSLLASKDFPSRYLPILCCFRLGFLGHPAQSFGGSNPDYHYTASGIHDTVKSRRFRTQRSYITFIARNPSPLSAVLPAPRPSTPPSPLHLILGHRSASKAPASIVEPPQPSPQYVPSFWYECLSRPVIRLPMCSPWNAITPFKVGEASSNICFR